MTQPQPARQPRRPDPLLYPDVAAVGSLAAALDECAARNGPAVGAVRATGDGSPVTARVTSRSPGLDQLTVHLGSAERVFLFAGWGRGVNLTNGSTTDLTELAAAAAAWQRGGTLAELHAAAPLLVFGALARAHERGPGHAVAEKWRRCLEPHPHTDPDLVRAAHAEPRLRVLFPFTSHGSLCFSRCTGYPYTGDVSVIQPLGAGRYAVHHPGERFSGEPSPTYTAREAAAQVVARLPGTWGPATAGTAHDLPGTGPDTHGQ
ncbi:DUF6193 family natural product biosynthesis protein [Streptomyces sp. NPDC008092]|uniref:DUF6193 family natural product biosynthesis protein n=1 Tax=Streptomyces sp. NPDC008092 TaxID=3364808 RepID=UPI0036EE70AD